MMIDSLEGAPAIFMRADSWPGQLLSHFQFAAVLQLVVMPVARKL